MRKTFPRPFVFFLCALFVLAPVLSLVSAGYWVVDPAWGKDGSVITDFNGLDDIVAALFLQPDGKLMVAGWVDVYPGNFGVARYLADGQLDPTFGDGGRVTTSFTADPEMVSAAWSINQRRDGGYLVFGEVCDADYAICRLALAAYKADGSLDMDFGQEGLVITDPGYASACAWPRRSIMQSNGKLVSAGVVLQENDDVDIVLLRYNTDGSLDTTFGSGGMTIIDFEGIGNYPQDIVALQGNKILVVGGLAETDPDYPFYYHPQDGFMARFNSDGALDRSFAKGAGYVAWNYEGLDTGGQTAVPVGDDLFVLGYADTNNGDCTLQRFNLDGTPDVTFGSDGWIFMGGSEYEYCWDLVLTPDNKLAFDGEYFPMSSQYGSSHSRLTSGIPRRPASRRTGNPAKMVHGFEEDIPAILVGRYHLNGTPDASFGNNGLLRYAINEDGNSGFGLAAQPDGHLLVISDVFDIENEQFDWGVVRFLEQGQAAPVYFPAILK